MRFVARRRAGVSSIIGSIFFVLIMIVAIGSLVTIFNSFTSYNSQVNQASNSNLQAGNTELSISGSSFGSFPPSTTSNYNVATSCTATTSTQFTNQNKLFYASGMWWDFFTCNSNFQYSTSFYGVTWGPATTIPSLVSGYTVGPYWDVDLVGSTIYLAIAFQGGHPDFQLGIGTLISGGTVSVPAGTISWTSIPAQVTTTANVVGPINVEVDSAGNTWVSVVQGATAIAVYARQDCASGVPSNQGWAPNSCSSAAAPTNYAPTALGTLSANANMVFQSVPSGLSSTGVVMIYETGSATVPSTGTLAVITQTYPPTTTWNTITLTGITDYSLTSSSAVFVGDTLYFAGLENAAVGGTTGDLKFWTLPFTSMTTATNTAEQTIESAVQAWMAALTSSGTTLTLFDAYPTGTTIQYYTSATLGSIWSSAIALESAETAINGLSPAGNSIAVTWANSANNVRMAALSTFTVTNNSPFSVHLVDLYIYNSATNSLVAHYYYNSTEDFDYYVGQGSSMVLPIRFIWAASTSYLVTIGTDTGVTAQLTVTSPPTPTTTCAAGYFPNYQIGPAQTCSSVPAAAPPVVAQSSSANTCTDATAATTEMMDLGVSYTTTASSTGSIYLTLTFNVATPATASGLTSAWTLAYGTGTAPACNNGAAAGTTVGQQYTIENEAAAAGGMAQSESVALTGLSANTAYWFDVQVSDSSGASWVYSNAGLSVLGTVTSGLQQPNIPALSTPSASCGRNTAATAMAGFGTTYTTGATGIFSGNVEVGLTFNVLSPATATGLTSKWQIAYGTGTPPSCNGGSAGTTLGNQYTVETVSATVPLSTAQSETVSITGLSASTTYWFDVQVLDSSAGTWTYSNPTMAVVEEPVAFDVPANTNFSPTASSCTVSSATLSMAGLTYYTTPSTGTGSVFVSYGVNVVSPATLAVTSKWQIAYGPVSTGTGAPACAATAGTGTAVGKQYTVETTVALAMSLGQSGSAVITGLSHGTEYWFAVQVTDSSAGSWVYSNPEVQVVEIMPATVPHESVVGYSNPSTCTISSTTLGMGGFATVYSTLSDGTGIASVTLNWKETMPATASTTATYTLVYGTGAPPACDAGSTGTVIGQTYEVFNPAGVATVFSPSETTIVSGLTPGVTYWFDVRLTDSVVTATTDALPTITVVEVI